MSERNEAAERLYSLFHAIRHDVKNYMSEAEMNATLDTALAHARSAEAAPPVEVLSDALADLADRHRPTGEMADAIGRIREWLTHLDEGADR